MSRYSPTVLEQPFDLGGVINQMIEGYYGGRQQAGERRRVKRQERREDEEDNRYLRGLRAADLAEPGARDLSEYLGDPQSAQLTQETLAQVGRADQANVPLAFERPAPRQVTLPGGDTRMFQERGPHLTASGIVMDPQAARSEQTLGTVLDEQLKQRLTGPQPWKPTTREEQIEFTRDTAVAQRAPERPRNIDPLSPGGIRASGQRATATRTPTEPEPPKSIGLIERQIASARRDVDLADLISPKRPESGKNGEVDPVLQAAFEVGRQRVNTAQARLDSLSTVYDRMVGGFMEKEGVAPERPVPQGTRGVPYRRGAGPRREFENAPESESPGLFPRLQRALPPDRVPAPSAAGGGAPSDLVGRARALRREHPDWTREQVMAELRRQDEAAAPSTSAVSPDLTLAQRQEMAAKEWEKLVDAGTDPDEATRLLREKYRLLGGQ